MGVYLKGTYILVVGVNKQNEIKVGSLGKIKFEKGNYAYVGSAMNSLEKRIERHERKEKKIFWHVDYLLSSPNTKLKKVFIKPSKKKEECETANKLVTIGVPVIGFGCSDCKCKSHLFKVNKQNLLINLNGFKERRF